MRWPIPTRSTGNASPTFLRRKPHQAAIQRSGLDLRNADLLGGTRRSVPTQSVEPLDGHAINCPSARPPSPGVPSRQEVLGPPTTLGSSSWWPELTREVREGTLLLLIAQVRIRADNSHLALDECALGPHIARRPARDSFELGAAINDLAAMRRRGAFSAHLEAPPDAGSAPHHKRVVGVKEQGRESLVVVADGALAGGEDAPVAPLTGGVASDQHGVEEAQPIRVLVTVLERLDNRSPATGPAARLLRGCGCVVKSIDQIPSVRDPVVEEHLVAPSVGADLDRAVPDEERLQAPAVRDRAAQVRGQIREGDVGLPLIRAGPVEDLEPCIILSLV